MRVDRFAVTVGLVCIVDLVMLLTGPVLLAAQKTLLTQSSPVHFDKHLTGIATIRVGEF